MPLSLPRRGAKGASREDDARPDRACLGREPSVKLTLKAMDDAGQEATSETKTFVLPERPFTNPLARAVVEQRRILSLDANQKAARCST